MELGIIANEFFETKPELLNAIETFEKKRRVHLLNKLRTEADTVNFFSILAEIHAGLFFDPLSGDMRYNSLLDRKRPDWLLTLNGQRILVEVLRLNTQEEECRSSVERNREMRRFQKTHPDVQIIEYGEAKTIDIAFLCGAQSKLQLKEKTYRDIIMKHHLPFIICVNPSLQTYISETDISDFLIGRYGFFATDKHFGRNVTGVLLQGYFVGQWHYFSNECAAYKLTEENKMVMEEWHP
ncbi:MAG TPA: hypothetical protein VK543_19125 [Puia sp.]|nr:hypothetical protein [Puia sp.]